MNSVVCKSEDTALELSVAPHRPAAGFRENLRDALLRAVETLFLWAARARQRRDLRKVDQRLLADMGLSAADVAGEVRKPFWKP